MLNRRPTPATVISLVALFFSLTGAGIAATHYLITSTSQIAPHVRHSLTGARGPRGPAGSFSAAHISYVQGNDAPGLSNGNTYSQAVCPPGSLAVGGGYNTSGQTDASDTELAQPTVLYSFPTTASPDYHGQGGSEPGWKVSLSNHGSTPFTYWAFAVCAR